MEIFNLSKSTNQKKKYMVSFTNPETKRKNIINFGAKTYDDFTLTNNINQKNRYIQRHSGMGENWTKTGIYTAGFWSRWLLWNTKTIIDSIKDIEKRFNIKINNNIDFDNNIDNEKIQKILHEKHSAYKSMKLSELGLSKPTNKRNEGDLLRWKNEKWLNLNALIDINKKIPCGTKYKGQTTPTVCRPSIRINQKTPKLVNEYTENQIKKAIKLKQQKKRINWNEL